MHNSLIGSSISINRSISDHCQSVSDARFVINEQLENVAIAGHCNLRPPGLPPDPPPGAP